MIPLDLPPISTIPDLSAPVAIVQPAPKHVPSKTAWIEQVRICILDRESHGDYKIRSHVAAPDGKYAYGGYQFQDPTFHHASGLPGHASDYSPAVQDAAFYKAFDNGAGRMAWNYPPNQCW